MWSIDEGKAILAAWTGKDFQPNIEYKLSSECPKIISFVFEYRSYFNNIGEDLLTDDEPFTTRAAFSRILPETLDFSKIVNTKRLNESIMSLKELLEKEEVKGNEDFKLFAILGYYGHHYMSFVRGKNSEGEQNYFLWEDAKIKRIGSFDALMNYLEKSKVIPYIVFYKLIEPKKTPTKKFIKKDIIKLKSKNQGEGIFILIQIFLI